MSSDSLQRTLRMETMRTGMTFGFAIWILSIVGGCFLTFSLDPQGTGGSGHWSGPAFYNVLNWPGSCLRLLFYPLDLATLYSWTYLVDPFLTPAGYGLMAVSISRRRHSGAGESADE